MGKMIVSIYRNTEEAMQAVCNIYGIEYGEGTPYADLEAAYKSVTLAVSTVFLILYYQLCG